MGVLRLGFRRVWFRVFGMGNVLKGCPASLISDRRVQGLARVPSLLGWGFHKQKTSCQGCGLRD